MHTPTPWTYDEVWALVKGPKGEEVCAIHSGQGDNERVDRNVAYANAELIVRAVNAHEAMREALEEAYHELRVRCGYKDGDHCYDAIKAAIALANGGAHECGSDQSGCQPQGPREEEALPPLRLPERGL